jgi:hypothetical protein
MEQQVKQKEIDDQAASRQALAAFLEQQGTGMFFDNKDKLAQAALARSGGISSDLVFPKLKAQ